MNEKLQQLYEALSQDTVYKTLVPKTKEEFYSKVTSDKEYAAQMFEGLKADTVYSGLLPNDYNSFNNEYISPTPTVKLSKSQTGKQREITTSELTKSIFASQPQEQPFQGMVGSPKPQASQLQQPASIYSVSKPTDLTDPKAISELSARQEQNIKNAKKVKEKEQSTAYILDNIKKKNELPVKEPSVDPTIKYTFTGATSDSDRKYDEKLLKESRAYAVEKGKREMLADPIIDEYSDYLRQTNPEVASSKLASLGYTAINNQDNYDSKLGSFFNEAVSWKYNTEKDNIKKLSAELTTPLKQLEALGEYFKKIQVQYPDGALPKEEYDSYLKAQEEFKRITEDEKFKELAMWVESNNETTYALQQYPVMFKKSYDEAVAKMAEQIKQDAEYKNMSAFGRGYGVLWRSVSKQALNTVSDALSGVLRTGGANKSAELIKGTLEAVSDNVVLPSYQDQSYVDNFYDYKGYKVYVDDEGKVIDIRDKEGYIIPSQSTYDKLQNEFAGKYSDKPKSIWDIKEKTEYRNDLLVGKLAEQAVSMAALVGGAGYLKSAGLGAKTALTLSGYLSSYEGNYQTAIQSGMAEGSLEARTFASAASVLTGYLENISPNLPILKKKGFMTAFKNSYIKALATKTPKLAVAKAFSDIMVSEPLNEVTQELLQSAADREVQAATNAVTGRQYFDTSYDIDEDIETAVLTYLTTMPFTAITGGGLKRTNSELKRSAIYYGATHYDSAVSKLDELLESGKIDLRNYTAAKKSIDEGKKHLDKLPESASEETKAELLDLIIHRENLKKQQTLIDSEAGILKYEAAIKKASASIEKILGGAGAAEIREEEAKANMAESAPIESAVEPVAELITEPQAEIKPTGEPSAKQVQQTGTVEDTETPVVEEQKTELDNQLKPTENEKSNKESGDKKAETKEVGSPAKATKDVPAEAGTPFIPKEGDTVTLPALREGGLERTIVFKEGEWQAKVGNETSSISKTAQKQAQEAYDNRTNETGTTTGNKGIPAQEQVEGKSVAVEETMPESAEADIERRRQEDFQNENESYRVIVGDEAFNDIVESGVVRTNANNKGGQTLAEKLAKRPTLYPSFSKGRASMEYANANPNNYIIVTEDSSIQPSTSGRHGKGTTMFPTDENGKHLTELSGEKIKVYKHIGNGEYILVYANGKQINAKYDAELDVLRGTSSTTTDKKADIERRRQEELKSEEYRIVTKSELYKNEDGDLFKVQQFANGKYRVLASDEEGRTLTDMGDYDPSVPLDKVIAGGLTKVKDLKFSNKIVDKINAKYDAELAALKTDKQEEQKSEPIKPTEESTKDNIGNDVAKPTGTPQGSVAGDKGIQAEEQVPADGKGDKAKKVVAEKPPINIPLEEKSQADQIKELFKSKGINISDNSASFSKLNHAELQAKIRAEKEPLKRKILRDIDKVLTSLVKTMPNIKVVLHDSQESFESAVPESKGLVVGAAFQDGAIHLNMQNIYGSGKTNFVYHEAVHPVLEALAVQNPQIIDDLYNDLSKFGDDYVAFGKRYDTTQEKVEAIVEFIADVANGDFDITPLRLPKIKRIFAKLLRLVGLNNVADAMTTKKSVVELAAKISRAFNEGKALNLGAENNVSNKLSNVRNSLNSLFAILGKAINDFKGVKIDSHARFSIISPLEEKTKLYKKAFGETVARIIRNKLPVAFDYENQLIPYLKNKIPIKSNMPFILNEIGNVIEQDFLKSLTTQDKKDVKNNIPSPLDLLKSVGYDYKHTATGNDVLAFRQYYPENGENGRDVICTYNDPSGRARNNFVSFIVKHDAKETLPAGKLTQNNLSQSWKDYLEKEGRKNEDGTYNLSGLKNHREDPYSTSVLSIQISKDGKFLKIISRYNHTIETGSSNPDATYGGDLDKIVSGLSDSLYDYFKVSKKQNTTFNLPDGIVQDGKGNYYNYTEEINGVYYGGDFYVKDGVAHHIDTNSERIIDGWLIKNNGDVKSITNDSQNEFILGKVNKVTFLSGNKVSFDTENGNIVFAVNNGRIGKLESIDKGVRDYLFDRLGISVKQVENGLYLSELKYAPRYIHLVWGDDITTIGGDAYFRDSQITDLGNLTTIGGDVGFSDSQITDLGNLTTIGGYAGFRDSQITDLGNLTTIGGDADFRDSQITDLGNLTTIVGNVYFRDSQITDLGNLTTIGGDAYFRDSQITDLGNLTTIGGYADFSDSQITDLGNLTTIGGNADFRDSQITDLGNLTTIVGNVYFRDSQITDLGNLTTIGGNADFSDSQITDLGNLTTIGGYADFSDSQITDLGNLTTIGGDADFSDSQITDLGNLTTIVGNAYFRNSQITDLGNLTTIGGNVYFRNSQITDLGNLTTIGGDADFNADQPNAKLLTTIKYNDEKTREAALKIVEDLRHEINKSIEQAKNADKPKAKFSIITPSGKKEVQALPEGVDIVNGFYSPLEKMLAETKFEKLPAKQWIEKFGKGEEAKWTGLQDWLSTQQGSVSKADIQKFLKENRVQVVEVVKSNDEKAFTDKKIKDAVYTDSKEWVELGNGIKTKADVGGFVWLDMNGIKERLPYTQAENYIHEGLKTTHSETKFGNYQLEGEKENYKEVLVTMPSKKANNIDLLNNFSDKISKKYGRFSKGLMSDAEIEEYDKLKRAAENKYTETLFKSSHFDEPNILVHLRMNTRTDAEGNRVLFLEEVQSDWGQKGKKEGFKIKPQKSDLEAKWHEPTVPEGHNPKNYSGYWEVYNKKTGELVGRNILPGKNAEQNIEEALRTYDANMQPKAIPSAPFVTDTNAWTKLGLKVALKEAVRQGADKIAWSTGTQQFDRWGSEKISWKKEVSSEYPDRVRWKLDIKEQHAGNAFDGLNIDEKALAESNVSVSTKERLRQVIKANLSRERNEAEIDKLTDRIWNRMQNEDSGTSLPRKEGMEAFYGVPKENKLGIVGQVAKGLFKQEPKTVEITTQFKQSTQEIYEDNKGRWFVDWTENDGGTYQKTFKTEKEASAWAKENLTKQTSTQHSIDITPEIKAQVKTGLPLFSKTLTDESVGVVAQVIRAKASEGMSYHDAAQYVMDELAAAGHIDPKDPKGKQIVEQAYKVLTGKDFDTGNTKQRGFNKQITDAIPNYAERNYKEMSNEQTLAAANELYNELGADNALTLFMSGNVELHPALMNTLGMVIMQRAREYGPGVEADVFADVEKILSERGTVMGQANQVFSLWKLISPEGAKAYAAKQNRKALQAKAGDKPKKARVAVQKAVDNAIDQTAAALQGDPIRVNTKETVSSTYGKSNKKVSRSRYNEIKDKLKAKFGGKARFSILSQTQPTDSDLLEFSMFHVEATGASFEDFADNMVKDLGTGIRPYLKQYYNEAAKELGVTPQSEAQVDAVISRIYAEEVAARVVTKAKDTTEKKDPVKILINTLLQKVTAKGTHTKTVTDIEKIRDAVLNKDEYAGVWKRSKQIVLDKINAMNISTAEKSVMVQRLNDYFTELIGEPFSRRLVSAEVGRALQGTNLRELLKSYYGIRKETRQSIKDYIIEHTGLPPHMAQELGKAIEEEYDARLKKELDKVMDSLKKNLEKSIAKESEVKARKEQTDTLYKEITELVNLGAFNDDDFLKLYAKKNGWKSPTKAQLDKLGELADEVQKQKQHGTKISENKAVEDLLAYQKELSGFKWHEIPMAIWYANVLSGHNTHIVNTVSNLLRIAAEMGVGAAKNPKNLIYMPIGLMKGFGIGVTEAIETWKTGYSPIRGKLEIPAVLERKITGPYKYPAWILKYVRRAMVAADVLMFEGASEMRAYQLARQKLKTYGEGDYSALNQSDFRKVQDILGYDATTVEAAEEYASMHSEKGTQLWKRLKTSYIHSQRNSEITRDASEFGRQVTYNYPPEGVLGMVANLINQGTNRYPAFKLVVPFTNIIANVANEYLNYTPVGLARAIRGGYITPKKYHNRTMTKDEIADLYVKAVGGMLMMSALFILSSGDDPYIEITANGYNDYQKNKSIPNFHPYSFRIKGTDTWIPYRYSPLYFVFAPIGHFHDANKYMVGKELESEWSKVAEMIKRSISGFFDSTFLSSVNTMLNTLFGGERGEGGDMLEKFMRNTVTTATSFVVPNEIYQGSQIMADVAGVPQKELGDKWYARLLSTMPYAMDNLNNKVDMLGFYINDYAPRLLRNFDDMPGKELQFLELMAKNKTAIKQETFRQFNGHGILDKDGVSHVITNQQYHDYMLVRGRKMYYWMQDNFEALSKLDEEHFRAEFSNALSNATMSAKLTIGHVPKLAEIEELDAIFNPVGNIGLPTTRNMGIKTTARDLLSNSLIDINTDPVDKSVIDEWVKENLKEVEKD